MLRVVGSPQTLWQAPMPRRLAVAVTALLALSIPLSTPAWATDFHHTLTSASKHHHDDDSQDDDSGQDEHRSRDDSDTSDGATLDDPNSSIDSLRDMPAESDNGKTKAGAALTGSAQTIQVQTTAYSNEDNQGGNNAKICCGVLHKEASGDGTYANPTTLAVPGSGGKGMQTTAGTRVYFVKQRFYGIVEDSGASPKALRRFDIWSDGRGNSDASGCMDELTGTSTAILNPPPGKPVGYVGPRSDSKGCHAR